MDVLPKWIETRASVVAAALIFGIAATPASAAGAPAKAADCPVAGTRVISFAHAVDGGGFVTTDGEEVRLAGILALGPGGEVPSDRAAATVHEAFTRALRDRTVTVAPAELPRDRYGRTLAQVFADGIWIQEALLKAGEVRAAPDLATEPCARALLDAEAEARERRAGQWRGAFRVRSPDDTRNHIGSYQIVEGDVVTASVTRGRAFINFGADYRTDFTVTIEPQDMRTFRQAKFDIPALSGKRIRVRGWVEFYNGPEITIATPAVIEVLQ